MGPADESSHYKNNGRKLSIEGSWLDIHCTILIFLFHEQITLNKNDEDGLYLLHSAYHQCNENLQHQENTTYRKE